MQRNLLLDNGFADVAVEVRTVVFTGAVVLPMLRGLVDSAWVEEQVERDRLAVGPRVD